MVITMRAEKISLTSYRKILQPLCEVLLKKTRYTRKTRKAKNQKVRKNEFSPNKGNRKLLHILQVGDFLNTYPVKLVRLAIILKRRFSCR
jgi:hypothetical protein